MGKGFYGWKLLLVIGVLYLLSSSFILITGSVVNPLMLDDPGLKLNAKMLGMGFTVYIWIQGLSSPIIGRFITVFEQRKSFVVGGFILVVGGLCMAMFTKTSIAYIIFFGVVLSFGSNMAGQLTMQSSVNTWFRQKRSIAMSIAMVCGSLGGFFAPFIINALVKSSGGSWQIAWYFTAFLGALVILIAAIFVRNKPSDLGQYPDGIDPKDIVVVKKTTSVYLTDTEYTFKQAIKSKNFWLIAMAAVGTFSGFSLAVSQGVIHFLAMGFTRDVVVGAISVMALANVIGKFTGGAFGDRIDPVKIYACFMAVLAVGIILASKALVPPIVYFILTGIGFGGGATLLPVVVGNFFGNKSFPENLGMVMMIRSVISGSIPFIGGYFYDKYGNSGWAFVITAVIVVIAMLCILMIRPPKSKI